MSDLRKAAEAVLDRWDSPAWEWMKQGPTAELMATLRTALAAPEPEPVALAHCPYTPPPSAHFGYVLGDHWLETAYSRVLDGEAEAEVLKDCGWERVTDAEALRRDAERYRWLRGEHSRIDPCIKAVCKHPLQRQGHTWAEIHDLDAIFDAAMGDKT
jgi:hypothetical protein